MNALENFEKAKALLKDSQTLRTAKEGYKKFIESDSNIDKYNIGFGIDDRFSMFKTTITFGAYYGYYGNSSCTTMYNANDKDEVIDSFKNYLKSHEDEILKWMADDLERKALDLKEKLSKEIQDAQASLEALSKINDEA